MGTNERVSLFAGADKKEFNLNTPAGDWPSYHILIIFVQRLEETSSFT